MTESILDRWGVLSHLRAIDFNDLLVNSPEQTKFLKGLIKDFPEWKPRGVFISTKGIDIDRIMANFVQQFYDKYKTQIKRFIIYDKFQSFFTKSIESDFDQRGRLKDSDLTVLLDVGTIQLTEHEQRFLLRVLAILTTYNKPFIFSARGNPKTVSKNLGEGLCDTLLTASQRKEFG